MQRSTWAMIIAFCTGLMLNGVVVSAQKASSDLSFVQRTKLYFVTHFAAEFVLPALKKMGLLPGETKGTKKELISIIEEAIIEEIADEPWMSFSYNFLTNPEVSIESMRAKIVARVEKEIKKYVTTQVSGDYKHKHDTARVRRERTLDDAEQEFIQKRIEVTALPAMKRLLGDNSLNGETMPHVAVVISGGGVRATLAGMGALMGLEDLSILPCIEYVAALSGSTWFLAPWANSKISLSKLKDNYFKPNLKDGLRYDLYSNSILVNFAYQDMFKQPYTLIDFFGILLASDFLRNFSDPFAMRLSQQKVDPVVRPYPILTLASPVTEQMRKLYLGYEYFEVTPHEVGSYESSAFIPTWSFGRTFKNGSSVNKAPEMPAGKYLALCGSAFLASAKDIISQAGPLISLWNFFNKLWIPGVIHKMTDFRPAPPQIDDFITGIPNKRVFVDAGVLSNLGGGLSFLDRDKRRNIDAIIFIDISDSIGPEYSKLKKYIDEKPELYVPIPAKSPGLGKELMSTMGIYDPSSDSPSPVIFYFPLINNPKITKFDINACKKMAGGECSTFNFKYSAKELDNLVKLMRKNIQTNGNKSAIIDVLRTIADGKKKQWALTHPEEAHDATKTGAIRLKFLPKRLGKYGVKKRPVVSPA